MIVGYIHNRINFSYSEQQNLVQEFSKSNKYKIDIFYSDIGITELSSSALSDGDTLIVSEISCLGKKLNNVYENLKSLMAKKIKVYSAREGFEFNQDNAYLLEGVDLAVRIRNSMVSANTSAALQKRKQDGLRVGMKKGMVLKKKLDGALDKINSLKEKGYKNVEIAKELGVSIATYYNYVRDNKLEDGNEKDA